MDRIFHLSFLLDRVGEKRIDLVSFYELSKLDKFIMERFKNTKDVRKKYEQDISEFCLDNMDEIKKENERNKRTWLGSIVIIADERDQDDHTKLIYKIPVIYQNDKKLLPRDNCLKIIKEKLQDKNVVRKLFEEKPYLLSDYEKHLLLRHYSRSDNTYLKSFIGNFYNRLKRSSDELLYYYCRALMHLFNLNKLTIKTSFGTIDDISNDIPHEISVEKENNYSSDADINNLIANEDYETLFNVYSFDELERETNLFRRRK